MSEIKGKVALLTGASSGIGYCTAKKLALEGARLSITARRENRLLECSREISMMKPEADVFCIPGDITNTKDVGNLLEKTVSELGTIDILINNAGVAHLGTIKGADMESIRRMFEINFFGSVDLIQRTLPIMLENNSGHIVFVTSFLENIALPEFGYYCASKAAMKLFAEALMYELSRTSLKVSIVSPGATDTEFLDAAVYSDIGPKKIIHKTQSPDVVANEIVKSIKRNRKRVTLTTKAIMITTASRISRNLGDAIIRFVKTREIDQIAKKIFFAG